MLWDGAPCYSKLVIDWPWVDPKDGFNVGIPEGFERKYWKGQFLVKDLGESALPTTIC